MITKLANRAGTSTRVPEVRVGSTNYPGINLLPVTRMLIIECINKKEFQANGGKINMTGLYKLSPHLIYTVNHFCTL